MESFSVRRGKQRAAGISLLASSLLFSAASQATSINFDFTADVGRAPGEVFLHEEELNVPGTAALMTRDYEFNFAGTQPLTVATNIGLGAAATWSSTGVKKLGVRANAEAYISAYDVLHPPPPRNGVIEVTTKVHIDAVITIDAAGVADGANVSFNLLDPAVHGSLDAPASFTHGTGTASIQGLFALIEFSTDFFGNRELGASKAKSFEISATTGDNPHRDFSEGSVQALEPVGSGVTPPPTGDPNPDFTVQNGREYLVILEFYARASLLPVPTTTGAPSQHVFSSSSFDGTLHWGGFGGFTDANGQPLLDVQVLDESGVDWATRSSSFPVPLPPAFGLLLGACGVLGLRRRAA